MEKDYLYVSEIYFIILNFPNQLSLSMQSAKPQVTILGVTSFLGAQTCLTFLQDGTYKVRGTVPDLNNEKML